MSRVVVGLDEVGRGCLAGPVIAAAVVLDINMPIEGLADSKKLSKKKREYLAEQIKKHALAWSIGRAEVSEIDDINILKASLLAMKRAYDSINTNIDFAKVDGIYYPDIDCDGECIKGGDNLIAEISAASIIAKVYRDNHMLVLDQLYPGYQLSQHKGYPTKSHKECIRKQGVSLAHRRSFAPVRDML